ncbi:hypothetical protein OESDEN_18372 [Oesophagostomum dentatum]|uniref:Uncharacterized protein n=1 Tax=Oesophagostomum dentatum TaxID=61180 RepID=A0A0B1SAI4_OESDE|nr:hypothetical protein OESDEN_18372 [Oesophagostomum dentatum]
METERLVHLICLKTSELADAFKMWKYSLMTREMRRVNIDFIRIDRTICSTEGSAMNGTSISRSM